MTEHLSQQRLDGVQERYADVDADAALDGIDSTMSRPRSPSLSSPLTWRETTALPSSSAGRKKR